MGSLCPKVGRLLVLLAVQMFVASGYRTPLAGGQRPWSLRMSAQGPTGTQGSGEKVLVIGSGGREFSIAQTLLRSSDVTHVFVAPGNAGTSQMSPRVSSVTGLDINDAGAVGSFVRQEGVGLVVVGPEAPLVAGLADGLKEQYIECFGCSSRAAEIEGSKAWSKAFMVRHAIPTAAFRVFHDYHDAAEYVKQHAMPVVVKASGLAAGKGAVVAETVEEALHALDAALNQRVFGDAGSSVVVEEYLCGEEVSLMGFCDGEGGHVACMPPARDYKRLLDGDHGPNTGGMGSVCPVPGLTAEQVSSMQDIMARAVRAMAGREGRPFVGVLYGGFVLTKDQGPKVLEFNCRMGDPETQSVLPLLRSDLLHVMRSCVRGTLQPNSLSWATDRWAVTVVGASAAYPGSSPKGAVPPLIPTSSAGATSSPVRTGRASEWLLTHAGTSLDAEGRVVGTGGRVLSVTGLAPSLRRAVLTAYQGLASVPFEGMQCRSDIGERMCAAEGGPLRVAVVGSTRGSSVKGLLAASSDAYRVTLVLSNRAEAGLLEQARELGLPWLCVEGLKGREQEEEAMAEAVERAGAEVVLLNGYSRVLSARLVGEWWGRCLNMHPSLLPDFAGLFDRRVHEAVLAAGRDESGCTAHLVSEQVDAGPAVVQLRCHVDPAKDDVDRLRARVQGLEARAWEEVLRVYSQHLSRVTALLLQAHATSRAPPPSD